MKTAHVYNSSIHGVPGCLTCVTSPQSGRTAQEGQAGGLASCMSWMMNPPESLGTGWYTLPIPRSTAGRHVAWQWSLPKVTQQKARSRHGTQTRGTHQPQRETSSCDNQPHNQRTQIRIRPSSTLLNPPKETCWRVMVDTL